MPSSFIDSKHPSSGATPPAPRGLLAVPPEVAEHVEQEPVVKIKAQGDAYFSILQRHPEMADVFRLGNRVVWVTPNRSVLVTDPTDGLQQMSDDEIDRLFAVAK